MAKEKAKAAAVATKAGSVNRKARNSLERRCLPKSQKVMFMGASRSTFKAVLKAWKDSRKKVSVAEA